MCILCFSALSSAQHSLPLYQSWSFDCIYSLFVNLTGTFLAHTTSHNPFQDVHAGRHMSHILRLLLLLSLINWTPQYHIGIICCSFKPLVTFGILCFLSSLSPVTEYLATNSLVSRLSCNMGEFSIRSIRMNSGNSIPI